MVRRERTCYLTLSSSARLLTLRDRTISAPFPAEGINTVTIEVLLLLVEDEPLIQLAADDALKAGGYSVVTASDGAEAIAVLDSRHDELFGVVTDIRLGTGPNGWDVARHARELKPALPVVYVTGDSAHEWPIHGVPKSVLVQKPYASAQLLTAISTLLTEANTNSTT